MKEEVYEIYVDASWNSKIPNKYSGTYIIYLNGKEIEKNSSMRKCKNNDDSEFRNLNRTMVTVRNKYYNKDKKQKFIFKSDCSGCIDLCNKLYKNVIDKKYNRKDVANMKNITKLLMTAIKSYDKNNIKFEWIPRKENSYADKLAVEHYKKFLISQGLTDVTKGLTDVTKYMEADLEYTLNKWKGLGLYKRNKVVAMKFEKFIKETFRG